MATKRARPAGTPVTAAVDLPRKDGQTMDDNEQPAEEGSTPPRRGTVRLQDAETSTPRPATAAEARQREKARKEREAAELAARQAAAAEELARERRADMKRGVLMGAVAFAGVAGIVGMGYLSVAGIGSEREVSATCVKDGTDEVVPDEYCSSGTSHGGGVFIYSGSPYRYYYGGTNGGVGTIARGGTLELPKDTVGRTTAGSKVSSTGKGSGVSITRGGFGSGSHGSSGG